MIVVDASAVVEVLLPSPEGKILAPRLFDESQTLHAPHLLDIEVTHAIRRYAAIGEITHQRGRILLDELADLPIYRYPHGVFLPRVWELRHNISAYDAVYVALAEALGSPLITHDRRLANSGGHRATIELI